jgi:TolA-binding protein
MRSGALAILALGAAGCVTQADLAAQQRALMSLLQAQGKAIQEVRSEVTSLRADLDRRSGRSPSATAPGGMVPDPAELEEASKLEQRVRELEQRKATPREIGMTPSPEGMSSEDPAVTEQTMVGVGTPTTTLPPSAATGAAPPQQVAAAPPPTVPAPPPSAVDAEWKREVAQERAVAAATTGAERAEYLGALDGLANGDCVQAIARLDAVGSGASPLLDNVLYWKARCAAVRGDDREAVSGLANLVEHYPRSDKAPAALWQEGKLLIARGDVPAARAALAKLVRDYPATAEAEQARRRLAELER